MKDKVKDLYDIITDANRVWDREKGPDYELYRDDVEDTETIWPTDDEDLLGD